MKLILFVVFMASAAYMTSAKKLLLVGGLNGAGMVAGLNGGLLTPGLVVGGVNPAILPAGGALIGQQPFAQMLPAVSPFMFQNPFAAAPFALPNPQAQLPPQPAMAFPPAMQGMPFLAPPNRQMLAPQLQTVGGVNPMGNAQQPQGDMPAGPAPRFRRTPLRRLQVKSAYENIQVTASPLTTEQPDKKSN